MFLISRQADQLIEIRVREVIVRGVLEEKMISMAEETYNVRQLWTRAALAIGVACE